jgi:hypothetical protein
MDMDEIMGWHLKGHMNTLPQIIARILVILGLDKGETQLMGQPCVNRSRGDEHA